MGIAIYVLNRGCLLAAGALLACMPAHARQQEEAPLRLQALQTQAEEAENGPLLADIDWAQAFADRDRQLAEFRQTQANGTLSAVRPQQTFIPQISERSLARLTPVRLPVLLPQLQGAVTARAGGQPGLMLMTRDHFYDASFHQDGVSVHITGTRIIHHSVNTPDLAAAMRRGRGGDGVRVSRDEGGFTADFSRYGAAYTISVECASRTDPRCADESFIRALTGRLVVAGGNPEEE